MIVYLTPAFVKAVVVQPGQARTEYCDGNGNGAVRGLYLEARATAAPGQGTWYLRYKNAVGKTCHKKLGTTSNMTLGDARAEARNAQAEIRLGADPRAEHKEQKAVPTLREFCEETYIPIIKAKNRSWKDDENRLNHRIYPAMGSQQLNAITVQQIMDFHISLKAEGLKGATADLHLSLLKRIFTVANDREVISVNPTERVQLFRDPNKVENYLNDEQFKKLLLILRTHKRRAACNLFLFLLSTGARLNEGLTMTWDQVDMAQRVWKVPAKSSKSKRLKVIPLNDSALEVLRAVQPEVMDGRVFVNADGSTIKSVQRIWESIRKSAGIPFFRLHDARHQMASWMINSGRTLYEVQQVLGHSSPMVTQRYAHLSVSTLLDAVGSADKHIQAAMPKFLPLLPEVA